MTVAPGGAFAHDVRVLLIYLSPPAGQVIFLLTLLVALYLAVIELREMEPRPHFAWWGWWISLVFLTHFVGYLILRVYVAYQRRQRARA
jgi:hypothetical protein